MSRFKQRSFAGGEIAPALWGRDDQTKYQTGLRSCRNFIVRREGGATNRPGTQFVVEVKDSTKAARLIPFVYDDLNAYVLEFGNGTIRWNALAAQLTVTAAAYNGATAYTAGDAVLQGGVTYVCILATTGNAPPNATYWYACAGTVYEIPSPWSDTQVADLRYVQSGDTLTLCHPSVQPYRLRRYSATKWALSAVTTAPSQAAPTAILLSGGAAGANSTYVVTAVNSDTYEESLASAPTTIAAKIPTTSAPIVLTWTGATGAGYYNVYRLLNGAYGFIGLAGALTFSDIGYSADFSSNGGGPPQVRSLFTGAGDMPSAVGYFQQRLAFGGTNNAPETFWLSKTGLPLNYSTSIPLQADDAITATISGRRINRVRHLIDLDRLILLTSDGVWTAEGDASGSLKPDAVNLRQQGTHGASSIQPVLVGNTALYIQARGSIVRDLQYDFQTNSYPGRDLTVFATHLFDGKSIVAWDYQEVPHSIVWAIQSDGSLLGLTFVRDHEVWGWHRHDSYTVAGKSLFESVACISESGEDYVYLIVKRTINGATKRYIERVASRNISDVRYDAKFADAFLVYDGRNTGATTLTLSGGTTWAYNESMTLTASAGTFVVGDVGKEFHLTIGGVTLRCPVIGYTSATVVTVNANQTVPVEFRGVATATWARAAKVLSGLSHLEAETVAVFADGNVLPQVTVASGSVTLASCVPYAVVGLPITADFETLDVDNPQGETFTGTKAIVNRVSLLVESSRGIFAGADSSHLTEYKQRDAAGGYSTAVGVTTGTIDMRLAGVWGDSRRIFVRQSDPLPLTLLSVVPYVQVGG